MTETAVRYLAWDTSRLGIKTRRRVRHVVAERRNQSFRLACGRTVTTGCWSMVAEPTRQADCAHCRRIEGDR